MKQRIITGALFGIVVLFLINFNIYTSIAFLVIIGLLSAYEYFLMVFSKALHTKVIVYIIIQCILAYILVVDEGRTVPDLYLLYGSFLYVLYSIFSLYFSKNPINHTQFALFHAAFYIVVPFVLLYKYLILGDIPHNEILLSILIFIWISDSGAYFVGSKIGKTKLFKRISPGKTWEGSIGAGIICILFATSYYFIQPTHTLIYWLVMAISIWIFGTYGDLYESSIKRQYGIKDSGNLLPGHGGFLDRFDSFIFVIPVVLIIWKLMF